VALDLEGRTQPLTPHSEPVCFDGAVAPACKLLGGPTLDLNLMLRRDAGSGEMQRAQAGADWRSPAEWRALYTSGPARLQIDGSHAAELAAAALVWHPYMGGRRWTFQPTETHTLGWWLSFQPRVLLQ
jgi:environmental stress-induced protein Ves